MKRILLTILALATVLSSPAAAETNFDGFLQGLWGGRLDQDNPTATEYTASEARMQLRANHWGDAGQFFGRLDFVWDGAESNPEYDWELREGYFKFRVGNNFDFKVGRQILTWGTGDLIFINDVFAKDYRSFFVGRDDQYLKAPQTALRGEYYSPIGAFTLVWTPRFEPNRLPTGSRLSFYSPAAGTIIGGDSIPAVPEPEAKFENSEIATRFTHRFGNFRSALYFYKGFYKNPVGAQMMGAGEEMVMVPYYPELNVYGASVRGAIAGGILWVEGGYFDSRDDADGDNPLVPNSTVNGLLGYERQIANNLTANVQWQVDYMTDYDKYETGLMAGMYKRDEVKHLLTSRWTKKLHMELIELSAFGFYSPSDEDAYIRLSAAYKYTDEVEIMVGGNIFDGNFEATDFGQFQKNDNLYIKLTYGFS